MFINPNDWYYYLIGQTPGKVCKIKQKIDGVDTERICAVIKVINNLNQDEEYQEYADESGDEPSQVDSLT